jgi:hypothetical protein
MAELEAKGAQVSAEGAPPRGGFAQKDRSAQKTQDLHKKGCGKGLRDTPLSGEGFPGKDGKVRNRRTAVSASPDRELPLSTHCGNSNIHTTLSETRRG